MVNKNKGFIALISSLIFGAIMLSIALTSSMGGYFSRADSLASEFLLRANEAADSCIQVALEAMTTSSSPTTFTIQNKTITIDSRTSCVVESIMHSGASFIIVTHASDGNSFVTKSIKGHIDLASSIQVDTSK